MTVAGQSLGDIPAIIAAVAERKPTIGQLTNMAWAAHDEGMPEPSSPPPTATDSPMFWLMLFGSTALIMLILIEPKFAKRQERLERMSQSRAMAAQNIARHASDVEPSSDAESPRWQAGHRPTLRPLILLIAVVVLTGSLAMRFVVARRAQQAPGESVSHSSGPREISS